MNFKYIKEVSATNDKEFCYFKVYEDNTYTLYRIGRGWDKTISDNFTWKSEQPSYSWDQWIITEEEMFLEMV